MSTTFAPSDRFGRWETSPEGAGYLKPTVHAIPVTADEIRAARQRFSQDCGSYVDEPPWWVCRLAARALKEPDAQHPEQLAALVVAGHSRVNPWGTFSSPGGRAETMPQQWGDIWGAVGNLLVSLARDGTGRDELQRTAARLGVEGLWTGAPAAAGPQDTRTEA